MSWVRPRSTLFRRRNRCLWVTQRLRVSPPTRHMGVSHEATKDANPVGRDLRARRAFPRTRPSCCCTLALADPPAPSRAHSLPRAPHLRRWPFTGLRVSGLLLPVSTISHLRPPPPRFPLPRRPPPPSSSGHRGFLLPRTLIRNLGAASTEGAANNSRGPPASEASGAGRRGCPISALAPAPRPVLSCRHSRGLLERHHH